MVSALAAALDRYASRVSVPVRYEVRDAVAVIALNDPPTRNALGPMAAEQLSAYAEQAAADPAVELIMLTGDSGVFCSGAAIRAWERLDETGETLTDRGTALCDRLATLPVPVVAALSGHAVGGGAELALAADWRIIDPAAEFRFVHTGFGLIPGFGGLARLERLVGAPTALRLLATRAKVGAEEAVALGLADEIVPTERQPAWAEARIATMDGAERKAIAAIKRVLNGEDERSAFLSVWPDRELPDRLGS